MARFGITAISLNGTQYSGIRGYQFDPGLEVNSEGSDGTVYETYHVVTATKPMAEFTTFSLKTMITALNDSSDLPLEALNGSTGLVMYGQKYLSGSPGFNASSVHASRTAANGVIYMTGIRWSRGQKAEMALRAMFKSTNGTTDPVTAAVNAALPTQPIPTEGFTLSALTINGSTITTVNSIDIAIDPRMEFEYTTGLPHPTDISAAGVNGKLAITLRADVGDIDLGSGTGSVSAVFTKYAQGGGLDADTVTLTCNANWTSEEGLSGDNGQPMSRTLVTRTRYAGSTRPFAWATA